VTPARCQLSQDVDGSVQVAFVSLPAVVDARHALKQGAIYDSLLILIFFEYSLGARCTAVTLDGGQVLPYVHHTAAYEDRPVARKSLHQCSIHSLYGCRRMHSMLWSVSRSCSVEETGTFETICC
jgi:hypothetical protein